MAAPSGQGAIFVRFQIAADFFGKRGVTNGMF
jgi:hypothetical protein